MRAFILYGIAFALMAVGLFTLALAGTLGLYLLELTPTAPPAGVLIVILLVALGSYAIACGRSLYRALSMLAQIKKELRHEIAKNFLNGLSGIRKRGSSY